MTDFTIRLLIVSFVFVAMLGGLAAVAMHVALAVAVSWLG